MDGNSLLTIAGTVIIVLAFAKFLALRKSYPPGTEWPAGPKTLPLIGNLHQLWGDLFHVALANLAKVHGGVFTIWLGSWNPVIIVSDVNSAREVLLTKSFDYSARNYPDYLTVLSEGNDSINGSDCGPFWHNLRKGLTSGALNPLNVTSQSHLQERDMQNLIKSMQENASRENGILRPLDYVKKEAIRLLSRTIFGQDFSNDEDFVVGIHHTVHHLISIGGFANLADAFKIGEYVPRHIRYIRGLNDVGEQAAKLILPHIVAAKPPTNSYLHFLKSQDFSDDVIVSLIIEVYGFATDSIASTIVWALTYLDVTGGTRPVKIADLNKMSYLKAVVKETIRMKPLGPMAIAHKATKNTSLMGRKIDKGTPVMVNIYAIQHNSKVFPEPYKFLPERFLNDVNSDGSLGDIDTMERSYLAFGAGMRVCAGMDIGKLGISFGIASLVNEFKWDCVSDGKLPDVAEDLSLILLIKNPLEARITPRVD
ncbi:hypothetical protein MKW92_025927 [Papaver armeniacum]|nr:hypothetical protein MKW92_025927 [Papaver armeniacum]